MRVETGTVLPRGDFGARYLLDRGDDVLASTERWGERGAVLELPGGPYRLSGMCAEQAVVLGRTFGRRYRPTPEPASNGAESNAEVSIELRRQPPARFREPDPRREWSADVERRDDRLFFASLWSLAVVDLERWRAVLWTSRHDDESVRGVVENLLRVVMAYRLLAGGGLLVHSAGVVDHDGQAHLFAGASGAGKSTLSRLSLEAGYDVVSDDLNAVFGCAERPVVERFPFAGDLRERLGDGGGRFPLGGVWRLEQAEEHAVGVVSPARMVAAIVGCCPYVNGDPGAAPALLSSASALVERVACGTLGFRRDAGFWPVIRAASSASPSSGTEGAR